MMKVTMSLAVLALIGEISAVELKNHQSALTGIVAPGRGVVAMVTSNLIYLVH